MTTYPTRFVHVVIERPLLLLPSIINHRIHFFANHGQKLFAVSYLFSNPVLSKQLTKIRNETSIFDYLPANKTVLRQ